MPAIALSQSTSLCRGLAAAAAAAACTLAQAAPMYWTDWTHPIQNGGYTAAGTITTPSATVDVTYHNAQGIGFAQFSGGTDYWVNSGGLRDDSVSPYTSPQVDNSPTGSDIIALQYAGAQTLVFSQAIANPVFAYVSLNGNGYAFDQDFDILSVGGQGGRACGYWGCGTSYKNIVQLPNGQTEYQLLGTGEPHGALRFTGTFAQVSWRSLSNEYWNGFTVGVQGTAVEVCATNPTLPGCTPNNNVPEPMALTLVGLALGGLGLARRRLRH